MGSLRTAFMLLAIVVFSSFSAIIGAISEGEAITRGDIPMLFIVIGSVIAGIVVLVALVAVYQVISYKHLYYELGPEEFNLYSGILNKKRVHVPLPAHPVRRPARHAHPAHLRRVQRQHRHGGRRGEQGRHRAVCAEDAS
ncbi:MAG: hypothetical protein ACLR3C_03205 [Eggerthella lenta]